MAFKNNLNFLMRDLHDACKLPPEFIDKEKSAFSIDGKELREIDKIRKEFIRITATFAFDCDLEFQEYSDVNKIIKKLGLQIEKLDDDVVMFDAIKKLIVYLDLQIGSKVSFYSTFGQMLLNKELEYDYDQLKSKNLYSFENLLIMFYKKSYEKYYRSQKKLMIKDNYDVEKDSKSIFNKERIINLEKRIQEIKKINIEKYSYYSEIFYDILSKFNEIADKKDISFVRKVMVYLEYNLELEIEDKTIVDEMISKDELTPDYKNLIFNENIDLEYLKAKFNYDGQVYRKGRTN